MQNCVEVMFHKHETFLSSQRVAVVQWCRKEVMFHKHETFLSSQRVAVVQWCRKEGNVLFNNALNTLFTVIWRQTYGKGPFT